MPDEVEIETKDLQETIEELQEERKEREETERRTAWTRYIALTTAILAVFAAVAALRAGQLVNEAVLRQLKASDTWNEYQADRTKDHLYSIQAYQLLDAGVKPPADPKGEGRKSKDEGVGTRVEERTAQSLDTRHSPLAAVDPTTKSAGEAHPAKDEAATKPAGGDHRSAAEGAAKPAAAKKRSENNFKPMSRSQRLAAYLEQVRSERDKEEKLSDHARELEKDGEEDWHLHERFAISVALIQVAIALGAVAALTRIKTVWALSLVVGAIGIFSFVTGLLPR